MKQNIYKIYRSRSNIYFYKSGRLSTTSLIWAAVSRGFLFLGPLPRICLYAVEATVGKPFDGPRPPRKVLPGWTPVMWWSATGAEGIAKTLDPKLVGH